MSDWLFDCKLNAPLIDQQVSCFSLFFCSAIDWEEKSVLAVGGCKLMQPLSSVHKAMAGMLLIKDIFFMEQRSSIVCLGCLGCCYCSIVGECSPVLCGLTVAVFVI